MGLPAWALGLFVFVILLAGGFIAWLSLRKRAIPEEIERLRRTAIHREGKMGDGEILDVEGFSIVYTYSVAGVVYTASQDATNLEREAAGGQDVDGRTGFGEVHSAQSGQLHRAVRGVERIAESLSQSPNNAAEVASPSRRNFLLLWVLLSLPQA